MAGIHFTSNDELHTLGALYESMLREMRDAAGDSSEFYTPRPVVRFMVQVIDPQLGEMVLDPASGTGGFLVESFNHLSAQVKKVQDRKILQESSLFGFEAKSLPFVARMDELAARISEVTTLRRGADAEGAALLPATGEKAFQELAAKHGTLPVAGLCTSLTDGDHNTPPFTDQGVRFIFVGNVSSGVLHFHGSKRVAPEYFSGLSPLRVPKRGDILYTAVGATLGIPALVDTDEPFCFQRHVAILKPRSDRIDGRFLWYMLQAGTAFAQAWAWTTGSAQPTVPLRAIRALTIPAPPIDEQQRIVETLDCVSDEVGSCAGSRPMPRPNSTR